MPLLEIANLKTYFYPRRGILPGRGKPVKAVDDVSFTIQENTTVGLIGNIGCGKSALAQTIARLVPATAGRVAYNGRDLLPLSRRAFRPLRKYIQILFQDSLATLDPAHSVETTLAETIKAHNAKLSAADQKQGALALLEFISLPRGAALRRPAELSHGQPERVALARALVPRPKLLLIDDTLKNLDLPHQRDFIELLRIVQDQTRAAFLFTCHDLNHLARLAQHILVMSRGRIVESAPTAELLKYPQHDFTKKLLESTLTLD